MKTKRKARIVEKLDWGRYVSPISDRNIVPLNWYSFKHRFGSELVTKIFSKFGVKEGDTVFDPFCGGGTTLIKSKLDGINSVGIDLSPFAVFITKVLTSKYNSRRLRELLDEISHDINENVSIPDVALLYKAFSENTLKYIFSLRESIESLKTIEREFFLFVLLCILDDVSKAKKAGGFLRITEQRKSSKMTVQSHFIRTAEKLIDEIDTYEFTDAFTAVMQGDAREYPNEVKEYEYDFILTSPPYPNRHDYTRIYELELLVGFIGNNKMLKSLRYDTLRSHVEAKKKFEADNYERPRKLKRIVEQLNERELNNSRLISTLEGYFEDMYLCLKEMATVLKKKKHIGLVVSNVRFGGIMVPVDELLSEIGAQVGLTAQEICVLRYRGNSSQQMKQYKREPSRESLIIWENG